MLNQKMYKGKMRNMGKTSANTYVFLVQDIFRMVSEDDLTDGFLLFESKGIEYNTFTIEEKIKYQRYMQTKVREFIEHMRTCPVSEKSKENTIFVSNFKTAYSIDLEEIRESHNLCGYKIGPYVRYIKQCDMPDIPSDVDQTAFLNMHLDHDYANQSCMFDVCCFYDDEVMQYFETHQEEDNPSDDLPAGYAIDFSSINDVAGMKFAISCLDEISPLTACCVIMEELTFFGMDVGYRQTRLDEIMHDLEESRIEIEEHPENLISHKDFMKELEDMILSQCKDDDEKEHYLLEQQFRKQVHAIEMRWAGEQIKQSRKLTYDMLKREYLDWRD